tara:strand:- start:51 stop:656 length:606 start_codon:yes stop_codon:yes gene_type:complete
MKFLITPYVYKNKYNKVCFSINKEWYDLFKKFDSNLDMIIYDKNIKLKKNYLKNYKGIILSGGGDIYKNKKKKLNLFRDNFEKKLVTAAIKYKIPILAICRGYQLIGNKFGFKQKKINFHKNTSHNIFSNDQKKIINVNSFHEYGITKLSLDFKSLFIHSDNTIEVCESKSKKILCFMFHPERFSKNQRFVNNLIKQTFKI